MNDILNRLTVLLALLAFGIVAVIGFGTSVRPMVCLFRATAALAFFGFFGRMGLRIVLKGILEELAKHEKEREEKAATQQATAAASDTTEDGAEEITAGTAAE
jgi:hypothetical protein